MPDTPDSAKPAKRVTRKAKPRGVLSDRAARLAKPQDKPYKLTDGNGLYLLVNPSGSKLWRYKYRAAGKEKLMALGAYPAVALTDAREARDAATKKLAKALDPMAERKTAKHAQKAAQANSFQAVATVWWGQWSKGRSPQHALQVWRCFEANVFPHIGARPVADVQAPELCPDCRRTRRVAQCAVDADRKAR